MSAVKVIESTLNDASTTEDIIEAVRDNNSVKSKKVSFLADIESKALAQTFANLEDFNIEKLMTILPKLIQHVENYRNLKGPQKRALVISMLKHIIDVTDGPGNDDIWDPILKQLVPSLIDTLITVNDGKLKLRKKPKWLKRVFLCCFN